MTKNGTSSFKIFNCKHLKKRIQRLATGLAHNTGTKRYMFKGMLRLLNFLHLKPNEGFFHMS